MCVYVCVYVRRIKGSYRFETRSRFPPGNAKRVVLWNKPVGQVYFGCFLSKEKKKKKKIRSSLVEERSFTFLCSPRPPRRPLATCKHQESAGRDPRVSK